MVILKLDDNLNVKLYEMSQLIKVRDDCLCNIKEFMPVPFIKLIHCYFLFYNDKRVIIKKNGCMINLKDTLQRENNIIDIDFKKTKTFKRLKIEHCFLFTEQYGDKNFHHWVMEQFVVLTYYLEILKFYPKCKLLVNKGAKLQIIRDILNLLEIDNNNLLLVDNNEVYIIKNLYLSTGRTFSINNIIPYINKYILNKVVLKNHIVDIDKLYIGNDNNIKKKVDYILNPEHINTFSNILDLIERSNEIIFDIHPIIDIIYFCKNIKNKKIVLLVNNKMDENIIYINLLRINKIDVYIVDKKDFMNIT